MNGGKYTLRHSSIFVSNIALNKKNSSPYMPQQIRVVECKNKASFESEECLLQLKQLSNAW